jgi:hypothetical protein
MDLALQQEERHPAQSDDDHQQRDFDEPGKPDPGSAMPFEFRIDRRHVPLAACPLTLI